MVIQKLCIDDIMPIIHHKGVFYDVPDNCPKEVIMETAAKRRMEIIGVKENGELIHAAWTFRDDNILRIVPRAKEFGCWHSKKGRNTLDTFWRKGADILFSDGVSEIFGFALSINRGQIEHIKKYGGKSYKDIGEVLCADGRKRLVSLNVLTRAAYYRLKNYEEYSIDLYKALMP